MTMNDGKNLHDGHRARLIERFNKNPDGFQDHELLELLLFNFVPRKNTNDIAHRLLRTFGSIGKILSGAACALVDMESENVTIVSFCGKSDYADRNDQTVANWKKRYCT